MPGLTHKVTEFMLRQGMRVAPSPEFPADLAFLLHRICMLQEELGELFVALNKREITDYADALGDVEFTLHALGLACGVEVARLGHIVADSNLTKCELDASGKGGRHPLYVGPKKAIVDYLVGEGWGVVQETSPDVPLVDKVSRIKRMD